MPSPRPPKEPPKLPDDVTLGGGGGSSAGTLSGVFERLGQLQASVTYLEGTAHDTQVEVKALSIDFAEAKGSFNTLRWVLGIAGAITLAIWGFIAAILLMMAKHYLNW